jgi:hypothetical protein
VTRAALLLVLATAACDRLPVAQAAQRKPPVTSRLPHREDLVCFPCHSHVKFEKGPPFAHGVAAHKTAGHCHVCHRGAGHEPREIERSACLTCHDERSRELGILATNDRKNR